MFLKGATFRADAGNSVPIEEECIDAFLLLWTPQVATTHHRGTALPRGEQR